METAIASYHSDHNRIPRMSDIVFYGDPAFDMIDGVPVRGVMSFVLSTPVAYVSDFRFYDPFMRNNRTANLDERLYTYQDIPAYVIHESESTFWPAAEDYYGRWRLISVGPDQQFGHGFSNSAQLPYDPTNGVVSLGNIIRAHKKQDGLPPSRLLGAH